MKPNETMDIIPTIMEMCKKEVANIAMLVGIIKSLTGLTISYQIIITRDTSKQSAAGPVSSLSLAVLGIKHATLANDRTLMCTHLLQVMVDTINLAVYSYHTNNKWKKVVQPLAKGCCLVLTGLGYAEIEDRERVCTRFGTCLGALSVVTLASPFAKLKKMLKDHDTATANLVITLISMIASLLWVLVALTVNNPGMLVQNVGGFLLNIIHIAVYFLRRK